MRKLSVKEEGDKAYLVEHKASGDEIDMTIPLSSSGGSGSGGTVGPNTVGTDQIQDGSILVEDLNEEVLARLNEGFATDDDIEEMFNE